METSMVGGMCRCCASEGAFKDVKTCYSWMGEDEVYADMLKDCFDIHLGSSSSGQYGGICEVCITQLRNAANFKKQVQQTEEQFKQLESRFFSTSIVKIEAPPDEDTIIHHDSDDNMHDSIDETFSANECEIKSEVPEEKPKKRARATTSRAAKKAKVGDPDTTVKRLECTRPKLLKETSETRKKQEVVTLTKRTVTRVQKKPVLVRSKEEQIHKYVKHHNNLKQILECTNASPIRRFRGVGYDCCFCEKQYPDPGDLKKHTLEQHKDVNKANIFKNKKMDKFLVKLDTTSLCCRLCNKNIDILEDLVEHLMQEHQRFFYIDINNQILPFKFDNDKLKCCMCTQSFATFKSLVTHMNSHYRNVVCEVCNAGFVTQSCYIDHARTHKIGSFNCDYCSKHFDTLQKKKVHEYKVHVRSNLSHKCGYCDEMFTDNRIKINHMVEKHNLPRPLHKCQACDKEFSQMKMLNLHVKRKHLLEKLHKCLECDMSFSTNTALKSHFIKHSQTREFKCDVCTKSFGRKKTLNAHKRIHEVRDRYKCDKCAQLFVQKISWRGHMMTKHNEIVN